MITPPSPMSPTPRGLDVERLDAWLAPRLDVDPRGLSYVPLTAGRSNLTYVVRLDGAPRWVLRRPPLGHTGASAHDVTRESRIFRALAPTDVPVPRVVATADGDGPLGVPFFVMTHVAGASLDSPDDFASVRPGARVEVATSMMDALGRIHAVDVDEVGLGDLRRPEPLVDRQLRRWLANVERLSDRGMLAPADGQILRTVHGTLAAHKPDRTRAENLCHGDFKPNNLIFDGQRVAAVLDWELAAVGDPGLDLGWLTVIWSHELTRKWAPAPGSGYPASDQLVRLYEARGPRIDRLEFFQAFALWKLACIRADVNARLRAGAMGDLAVEARPDDPLVAEFARAALDLITA